MFQNIFFLCEFEYYNVFVECYIGFNDVEIVQMFDVVGYVLLDVMIDVIVLVKIKLLVLLVLLELMIEVQVLVKICVIVDKNIVLCSFIGQGYYGIYILNVILCNILENLVWYIVYILYQVEILQGCMEVLINFQILCVDFIGMEIVNVLLLDEVIVVVEVMMLVKCLVKLKLDIFFVYDVVYLQILELLCMCVELMGIVLCVGILVEVLEVEVFGLLLQYLDIFGQVGDYKVLVDVVYVCGGLVVVVIDLLVLILLVVLGEWGVDIVVGNSQCFGVLFGFGGLYVVFMVCCDVYKCLMLGCLIGVFIDVQGNLVYCLILQICEQYICCEKVILNICIVQVLLVVMVLMYVVYYGLEGLICIVWCIYCLVLILVVVLCNVGVQVGGDFFDILYIIGVYVDEIYVKVCVVGYNLCVIDSDLVGISLDEIVICVDVVVLVVVFGVQVDVDVLDVSIVDVLLVGLLCQFVFLIYLVFNIYYSEYELLCYLCLLVDKDLVMDCMMILLGLCIMKFNVIVEMILVIWLEFLQIYLLVLVDQVLGYKELIDMLEVMLVECIGYDVVSLQLNFGVQGEYVGLLVICVYYCLCGEGYCDICLILDLVYGINLVLVQMCGMKVVVIKIDVNGNVDVEDICFNVEKYSDCLVVIMMIYLFMYGVFEEEVVEICEIIYKYGGQVYIDGVNMNVLVGVVKLGKWGLDVLYLNLYKIFCILYGGGGLGVGLCVVKEYLVLFLLGKLGDNGLVGMVSVVSFGSVLILLISWMYIVMMGCEGLCKVIQVVQFNVNYIVKCLVLYFKILYIGCNGLVVYECIFDVCLLEKISGIGVEDVVKCLIDFGFYVLILSFLVVGMLMVELIESELLYELDCFINVMIQICEEISVIEDGCLDCEDNLLKNVLYIVIVVIVSEWIYVYLCELVVFLLVSLKQSKYWLLVVCVDNVYGDKNVMCVCILVDVYKDDEVEV